MFPFLKNTKKGLTLIELLVVIAIIGILSSIVLASLTTSREKARDAKRISDVGQIKTSLELFFDKNQSYPTTTAGIAVLIDNNFLPQLPTPPIGSAAAYVYNGVDATGADCSVSPCIGYALGIDLERTDNTVLTADADQIVGTVFYGAGAVDCTHNDAGADKCYDAKA
jgi:type II secretion system protein G